MGRDDAVLVAGANLPSGMVNAPPFTGSASPDFSPRRVTGYALVALKPEGRVTVTSPVTWMTPLQVVVPAASEPVAAIIAGAAPSEVIVFCAAKPPPLADSVKLPGFADG